MLSATLEPVTTLIGADAASSWLSEQSLTRNILFTVVFIILTVAIISRGVENGIEKWSKRLMPALLGILFALIAYVMTQEGAVEGLKAYLVPDFSSIFDPTLLVSALGQAFFSLSLGTSVMIIYGSYISKKENLVSLGAYVTLIDVFIAFVAGLLISLEVWQSNKIYDLVASDALQSQEIQSIGKAVNHVDADEQTLRELVLENRDSLAFIKGQLSNPDNDNEVQDIAQRH